MGKKTRRHSQKGGDLNGNPPSSWGWMLGTVGNGWTQFLNTFQAQPGQNLSIDQSNNIVPVKGVPLKGGRRHKKKHGGNIVSQAAVPLVLVGLNQMAKTKKHRHHKRKH